MRKLLLHLASGLRINRFGCLTAKRSDAMPAHYVVEAEESCGPYNLRSIAMIWELGENGYFAIPVLTREQKRKFFLTVHYHHRPGRNNGTNKVFSKNRERLCREPKISTRAAEIGCPRRSGALRFTPDKSLLRHTMPRRILIVL